MASFTRSNGDAQPVFALDTSNGKIAADTSTAATPVHPAGPRLDYFGAVANTSVAGEQGVDEYVANVIEAIQNAGATVAAYQVDATALSFAVYPAGAFADAAAFLSTANITYTGFQLNSSTDVGFKLATS
jgi:hypothetical protein